MKSLLVIVFIGMALGCQNAGLENKRVLSSFGAPSDPRWTQAGLTEERVQAATHLYLWKCSKCHGLYNPRDYQETEWQSWMDRMSRKSHLSAEENRLVLQFTRAIQSD